MCMKHILGSLIVLVFLSACGKGFSGNNPSDWGSSWDPANGGSSGGDGGSGPGSPNPNPPATGAINTNNRTSVVEAYRNWFGKPTPDMGFTGNVQNCVAGTTSIEFQQATIDRINWYRAMVGIKPVTLTPNLSNYQEAALMMDANNQLSHSPPAEWRCYTSAGAGGAGSSNLALGANGPYAIDIYIDDFGGNNSAVGHRRWILLPGQSTFATGDVPGANSLAVWQGGGNETPAGLQFVAWPSAGYFPGDVIPGSGRWSFSNVDGGNLGSAVVTMKNMLTGANIPVTMEPFYSGYGAPTLVWIPQGIGRGSPSQDTPYQVSISNVGTAPNTKTYTYTVIVINPN